MKSKYRLLNIFFFVFWSLLQIGKGFGLTSQTNITNAFSIISLCAIPFGILTLIFTKWKKKEFVLCIVLNILGLLNAVTTGTATYFLSIFCITAIKDINIRETLKVSIYIRSILFVLRTTLAIAGITDMQESYRFSSNAIIETRYALGYAHPNTTQFELCMIIILIIIVYAEKIKLWHCLLMASYNVLIFSFTNSRTSFGICSIFLIGIIIINFKQNKIFTSLINIFVKTIPLICILFTITGCVIAATIPEFKGLGTFASRFYTANETIITYPISLLGTTGITTDLGFVYLLYSGGIIIAILHCFSVIKFLYNRSHPKHVLLCWAFVCLILHSMMEHTSYSVLSNGLLLYLSTNLYKTKTVQRNIIRR